MNVSSGINILAVLLVGVVEGRLKEGPLWWWWTQKTSWQWVGDWLVSGQDLSMQRGMEASQWRVIVSEISVCVGSGLLTKFSLSDPRKGLPWREVL